MNLMLFNDEFNMDQKIKDELCDAVINKRIELIDQGNHPGAHSEPFTYKTKNGDDFVLLRAREKGFITGYKKQKILYPFLLRQNLPVRTARFMEIIEINDDTYAVTERFFGHGHGPGRFADLSLIKQAEFIKQVALFFFSLHSIPTDSLPPELDYKPYFKYNKNEINEKEVFLHADFNYSNFLIDDDYNLHAVFDWHPACIGPRIAEFATFVYCNDVAFLPPVLDEYNKLAGTSINPDQVIRHNSERQVY